MASCTPPLLGAGMRTVHGQSPVRRGNLRVDYVLASKGLRVRRSGVFWPTEDDPLFRLVGDDDPDVGVPLSSGHRLVYLDLKIRGRR